MGVLSPQFGSLVPSSRARGLKVPHRVCSFRFELNNLLNQHSAS